MTVIGRKPGGSILRAQKEEGLPGYATSGISVSFVRTRAGGRGAAVQAALDEREPVEFTGQVVPHARAPGEARDAHGGGVQEEAVQMIPPVQARSWPVKIEVESPEGKAIYPYVDLRCTSADDDRVVMTNEGQGLPWLVTLEMADESTLNVTPRPVGHTVYQARAAAAFALAVHSAGAVVRVVRLDSGKQIMALTSSASASEHEIGRLRSWYALTDKLCLIQQRIIKLGQLSIEGAPAADEIATIDRLFAILGSGVVERAVDLSLTLQPSERAIVGGGPVHISLDGGCERLFGVDISLGRVKQTIKDRERFVDAVHGAAAEASSTGEAVSVQLRDLLVIEEYLDWQPESAVWDSLYSAITRLAANVGRYDGYFTRADARAAGISDAVFEAALREQNVEPIAADVYHIVQFPRADREEFITLWLQTDRQGVLSHDTALFLHELCDILPRRSHVTVPPGWDPGARKLDGKVVLHHGEVGEDEIRWLGPVPYTAPLRTLRDCIASHLPPDLIEQATAEGERLGMFTEADLLRPDERKGAA